MANYFDPEDDNRDLLPQYKGEPLAMGGYAPQPVPQGPDRFANIPSHAPPQPSFRERVGRAGNGLIELGAALSAHDPRLSKITGSLLESKRMRDQRDYGEQMQNNQFENMNQMQSQQFQHANQMQTQQQEWQGGIQQNKINADREAQAQKARADAATLENENKKRMFEQEDKLRDEYNVMAKPYRAAEDQYNVFKNTVKSTSPAGDMGAIYSFMKILDPSSTVREGEYASAAAAAGLSDLGVNYIQNVLSGQKLTPLQRDDFARQVEEMMKGRASTFKRDTQRYHDMAGRNRLNVNNIIDERLGAANDPRIQAALDAGYTMEEIEKHLGGRNGR